jgi:hypothetical protein
MTYPTVSRYLFGVAALLITFGSLGLASIAIRRRHLAAWDGALARLAEAVIGLALLTLMLELLGAVGLFSLVPIALASVAIGLAAASAIGRVRREEATAATRPRDNPATTRPPDPAATRPPDPATTRPPDPAATRPPDPAATRHPDPAATRPPDPAATRPPDPAATRPPDRADPIPAGTRPPTYVALVFGAVAIAATTAVVAEWGAITLRSYDVGIRTFDSVWYHLPWASWFAQTGHVTPLRFTDAEYLAAFYPATAELFHGLGIVLFARDTASPGMNLAWLGLVLLAGYCVGRPRGAGSLTLTATALAMGVPAIDVSQAGSAANDVVGVFFVLAAVALLVNGRGSRAGFVLAAVSAGLAVSVKLSMLAPVAALTIGAVAVAPRGQRRAAAALWLIPLVITGAFWYLRNLIAVGNPLPWLNLPGLATPAPALQQHTGFSVAHYLTSTHAWNAYLEPGLASGLGPWWYAIVAMAVAGPVLCLLRGADAPLWMLAIVALASLAAYLVTPETAAGPAGDPLGFAFNLRYAAPVLALSLPLLPLAPALDGARRRLALAAGLIAALAGTIAQAHLWPAREAGGAIGIAVAVLVVAATWTVLAGPSTRRPLSPALGTGPSTPRPLSPAPGTGSSTPRPLSPAPGTGSSTRRRVRPAVIAAGAVVVLLAAVLAGDPLQRHYLDGRYAFHRGVSSLAGVWAFFRGVHDARVGVVGTFGGFFSYPLFGIDDSNHVEYVGRRGPHGSFAPIRTCTAWRTAVNAGHFRYLVTTPARDPWHPKPLHPSPERAWTVTDPSARLIYTHRAFGQPISIFELRGALQDC